MHGGEDDLVQTLLMTLINVLKAHDAVQTALRDKDADPLPAMLALEQAREIGQQVVLLGESHAVASATVTARWAAAGADDEEIALWAAEHPPEATNA